MMAVGVQVMQGHEPGKVSTSRSLKSKKDRRQEEKGATEDEMVGWHHQLDGHELGQTEGDGEGQGRLVCCSPWGCKELDTTW